MRRRFVQYDYTEATTGNHSRLTKITYPDGYTLSYTYATGVDSNISRLTSISDASGILEAYSYQGGGTVLQTDRTQPGLTPTKTPDGFGRVMDFDWQGEPGGGSPGSKVHFAEENGTQIFYFLTTMPTATGFRQRHVQYVMRRAGLSTMS